MKEHLVDEVKQFNSMCYDIHWDLKTRKENGNWRRFNASKHLDKNPQWSQIPPTREVNFWGPFRAIYNEMLAFSESFITCELREGIKALRLRHCGKLKYTPPASCGCYSSWIAAANLQGSLGAIHEAVWRLLLKKPMRYRSKNQVLYSLASFFISMIDYTPP